MAADMTFTGEFQAKGVVTGMQEVGRAADTLKNKVRSMAGIGYHGPTTANRGQGAKSGYQRAGMGALEVSRGVEDFAVAGMRGLLNNIPGMIMSFGGSMGLAAAVSLVAVGVTVLGKGLYDLATDAAANKKYTDDMKSANDKYASSLSDASEKMHAYRDQQKQMNAETAHAAKMAESMRRFGDPLATNAKQGGLREAERSAAQSINALQSELAGIGGGAMPSPMDMVGNSEEDRNAASKLLSDLMKQRAMVEREMEKSAISGMGDFSAKMHDIETAIAWAERESARHKANMERAAEVGSEFGEMAGKTLMEKEKRTISSLKEEKALLEQKEKFNDAEIRAYEAKLALIDEEIKAAVEGEKAARNKLYYAKEEAALRTKIEERTKVNAERQRFGGAVLEQIEKQAALMARFAEIDSSLGRMGIGGSDMLSSSGRIGGSVKEYNSAIATINYQRDTLKELRAIARNTARKQPSTYN